MCYIYQTCKAGQVLRGGAALGDVLGGNTLGPVCLGGDITHTHTHTQPPPRSMVSKHVASLTRPSHPAPQ